MKSKELEDLSPFGKWQLDTTLGQYNTKIILCENTAFSVVSFVPGKGIYHVAGLIF